ncbi:MULTISPECIES: LysR family transcriptional regulator [Rhizobium]|uniref:LysR family transcriptional regulator n=1 Tax=Rhizobium TaxID=379 RepID=UPI00195B2380|nr:MULTISPECIES: LysR family transcriptional regulator [Rhizobium]MBM7044198.1 LysR family transcriptional regulator [Rhizobium lusitanum]
MDTIDNIHIRRLDLTLLIVFEMLLKKRNMSAVAVEMGLTQSAVSHAVGRLRSVFDDPLFIRKGAGVEPTARALLLGPPLAEALAGIRGAVQIGRHFDPGTAARRFTVAAPDTLVAALAEAALARLAQTAPRCQIMFRTFSHESAAAAVAAGDVDVALGVFADAPRETIGTVMAYETFRVASRRDHPHIKGTLDLDTYCSLDHILVSHDRDARGMIDAVLDGIDRRRRIAAIMPQMLVAFAAASRSDAIITAPLSACLYAASLFPVTLHDPPMAIPGFQLTLLRHRDGLADPAITWLAKLVTEALSRNPQDDHLH